MHGKCQSNNSKIICFHAINESRTQDAKSFVNIEYIIIL